MHAYSYEPETQNSTSRPDLRLSYIKVQLFTLTIGANRVKSILSAHDLIENYTYEGKKIDRKFLQKKVGNAVNALFLGKKEKESHKIGEFERARRGMYSKCRTYEI